MAIPELKLVLTEALIRAQVNASFPADARSDVFAEVARCRFEDTQLSHRVQLAIIKLSKGNASALPALLELALRDYRDVLGPAEYAHELACQDAAPSAGEQVVADARRRDLEDYQNWLLGSDPDPAA